MKFKGVQPIVTGAILLLSLWDLSAPNLVRGQSVDQPADQSESIKCNEVYVAVHANNEDTLKLSRDFMKHLRRLSKRSSEGYRYTIDIIEGEDVNTPYSNEGIDSKPFNYTRDVLGNRLKTVRKDGDFPDNDEILPDIFQRLSVLSDNSEESGYSQFHAYILTEGTVGQGEPDDEVANQIEAQLQDSVDRGQISDNLQVYIVGVQRNRSQAVRFLNPISAQSHSASLSETEWKRLADSYVDADCKPE